MKQFNLTIVLAVIVLIICAFAFTIVASSLFGSSFTPNLYATLVGAFIGAIISLLVIPIYFNVEKSMRAKALMGARILFLREQGESLKEAYIRFVDTLGLGGSHSVALAGESWQGLDQMYWPDIQTIERIQSNITSKSLITSNFTSIQPIKIAYDALLIAVKDVLRTTSTSIFEGNEDLTKNVLFEAYFHVNKLAVKLNPINVPPTASLQTHLTGMEPDIKQAAIASGKVLMDLCRLADKIKPLITLK